MITQEVKKLIGKDALRVRVVLTKEQDSTVYIGSDTLLVATSREVDSVQDHLLVATDAGIPVVDPSILIKDIRKRSYALLLVLIRGRLKIFAMDLRIKKTFFQKKFYYDEYNKAMYIPNEVYAGVNLLPSGLDLEALYLTNLLYTTSISLNKSQKILNKGQINE